jgi:hypothetical protein
MVLNSEWYFESFMASAESDEISYAALHKNTQIVYDFD